VLALSPYVYFRPVLASQLVFLIAAEPNSSLLPSPVLSVISLHRSGSGRFAGRRHPPPRKSPSSLLDTTNLPSNSEARSLGGMLAQFHAEEEELLHLQRQAKATAVRQVSSPSFVVQNKVFFGDTHTQTDGLFRGTCTTSPLSMLFKHAYITGNGACNEWR